MKKHRTKSPPENTPSSPTPRASSAPRRSLYEPSRSLYEYGAPGAEAETAAREAARAAQLGGKLPAPGQLSATSEPTQKLPRWFDRHVDRSGGAPLPYKLSTNFGGLSEAASRASIFADARSDKAARHLGTRAFTAGTNIHFRADAYRPEDPGGRALIAHELTHVAQHLGGAPGHILRGDPGDSSEDGDRVPVLDLDAPPPVRTAYTPNGLYIETRSPTRMGGHTLGQVFAAMVVEALAPAAFSRELVGRATAAVASRAWGRLTFDPTERPSATDRVPRVYVDPATLLFIAEWLQERGVDELAITDEQFERMRRGAVLRRFYDLLKNRGQLPTWMARELFVNLLQHRESLADRSSRVAYEMSAGEERDQEINDLASRFIQALRPDISLLERIGEDATVADRHDVEEIFGTSGGGEELTVDSHHAYRFVRFSRTVLPLREAVLDEGTTEAITALLDAWSAHVRAGGELTGELQDVDFVEGFTDRNAPPLPVEVRSYPPLAPPLFDVAQNVPRHFLADATITDRFEILAHAFGAFTYRWSVIRVDPEKVNPEEGGALRPLTVDDDRLIQSDQGYRFDEIERAAREDMGYRPSGFDALGARLERQAAYLMEDLQTFSVAPDGANFTPQAALAIMPRLVSTIGSPQAGITQFLVANRAISAVGDLITTIVERASLERHEESITFTEPGLHIVRVVVEPQLDEDSRYRRAPGIAWMPVYVRDPESMATIQTHLAIQRMEEQQIQLADAIARLESDRELREWSDETQTSFPETLSEANRQGLEQLADALDLELHGDIGELLQARLAELESAHAARQICIPGREDYTEREFRESTRAIEELRRKVQWRACNVRTPTERLRGTFVGDEGITVSLMLEAHPTMQMFSQHRYRVIDYSGPSVTTGHGWGPNRQAAVEAAVVNLLQGYDAYGRGYVSILVPEEPGGTTGTPVTRRVAADMGAVAMEGIENISLVVTLAALAAAPLTGGASLTLMIPVGVIGATPSAYRLIDRGVSGTLYMDMRTAMEVVDVLGSLVGLATMRAASTAARTASVASQRTARGLVITGLGLDGLGVAFLTHEASEQIRNLPDDMPEGMKRAIIMQVVGNTLMSAGMMVGGELAGRASAVSRAHGYDPASLPAPGEFRANPRRLPDGAHSDAPPTTADLPPRRTARARDFEAQMREPLRDVGVYEDPGIGDRSIRINYETDAWGGVTDIRIHIGRQASVADFHTHVAVARQMSRYRGISGRIRVLINRFARLFGARTLVPGTRAFEAYYEVRKLPELIQMRMDSLAASGQTASRAAIDAELVSLREQLSFYQRRFEEFSQDPGRGSVRAEDPGVWSPERLRAERPGGVQGPLSTSVDRGGWTGRHEIRFQVDRLEQINPARAEQLRTDIASLEANGYTWYLSPAENGTTMEVRSRRPRQSGDTTTWVFAGDRLVNFGTVLPSNTTRRAVLEHGYPQPPPHHHYVDQGAGVFDLRRNQTAPPDTERMMIRTDPETGLKRIVRREHQIDHRARYDDDFGVRGTDIDRPPWKADFDREFAARERALAERDSHPPGSDSFNASNQRVREASERIGLLAADTYMQQRRSDYPELTRVYPPGDLLQRGSSGDFDLVYSYRSPDGELRFVVVEAKGGSGSLGSRRVGEGGIERAQQGSPEYFLEISQFMRERLPNSESGQSIDVRPDHPRNVREAFEQLAPGELPSAQRRQRASELFTYLHVEMPIHSQNQPGELRVRRFLMNED